MTTTTQILLVEDNPGDVTLITEALQHSGLNITLNVVENGDEAIAYLHRHNRYQNAPRPQLILLDLNLPRKDGREVLQDIKTDHTLSYIPVVVLTTSRDETDIMNSYRLNANAYIPKPTNVHDLVNCIKSICDFWFVYATTPNHKG